MHKRASQAARPVVETVFEDAARPPCRHGERQWERVGEGLPSGRERRFWRCRACGAFAPAPMKERA